MGIIAQTQKIMSVQPSSADDASSTAASRGEGRSYSEAANVSGIIHALGRSANTVDGDGPALKIFSFWRRVIAKKEGELSKQEIANDNLQSMFLLLCSWLKNTPIPRYWKIEGDQLLPKNPDKEGSTDALGRV